MRLIAEPLHESNVLGDHEVLRNIHENILINVAFISKVHFFLL